MRFLLPVGGQVDDRFAGILTTPGMYGIAAGITAGLPWAADNQAFTKGFDAGRFFPWLASMEPYRERCLFVTVPDVVGDAVATMTNWRLWQHLFNGWPLAFAAQDGQEDLPLPVGYDVLFVGGSTEWKESPAAISVIKRAQAAGKRIHIGRVNWWRRYRLFRQIAGSEEFTCDGTRQRFEGIERAKAAWADYQRRPVMALW